DGRSGKVASIIIGDETGTTRVTLWGSKTDDIKDLKEDDIVKIKSGYSREDRNKRSEIHLNDNSQLVINPKGEKIDEVKRASPIVSVRKKIVDVVAGDENIEVLGTVVQAYDPVFWEACPTCNKRIKETGDGFECADHGVIPTPDYGYVMNAFIDDGSESIRTVFFRNQLQHLIGKNHDEVVQMRNANFEEVKDDILGKIVSVVGRVTENEMFARKELVAQLVNTNPDPKDELERLSAETPETPKTTIIEDDEKVEEVAKDEVVEEETTSVEEEAPKEVVEEVLVSEEDEKVEEEVVEDLEESDENFDEETPLVEDDEIKQGVEDEVIEDDEEPLSLNDLEEVDDDDDIYS
ncbi:hypothetical protein GOV05_03860, partial [Candidatus Woesearchaeota archaeon]|nr:hypothetical protein [Candidatus Woesearchaeota archaeon]